MVFASPDPTPEELRAAKVASIGLTTFLLPAVTMFFAVLFFNIAGFFMMYSLDPVTPAMILTCVGMLLVMAPMAIGLRYALKRFSWSRPLGIVLSLYVALLLPLLPVPFLAWWLTDTGLMEPTEPVSRYADGMPWLLGAYLHVAAVSLVLVLLEYLARGRARDGAGWARVTLVSVALLVTSLFTSTTSYGMAVRDTAAHVRQEVALIGDFSHPIAVLEAPGWSLWRVRADPDRERFRVDYRFEDDVHGDVRLEVLTEPLDPPMTECPEESGREDGSCTRHLIEVPGLTGEGRAEGTRVLRVYGEERRSLYLELEVLETDQTVLLSPWAAEQSWNVGISEAELVALTEQLTLLDPNDTEAVRELSLQAHLT